MWQRMFRRPSRAAIRETHKAEMPEPKFQFSLRTLFAATTLCGLLLALAVRVLPGMRNDQLLLLFSIFAPLTTGALLTLAGHRLAARAEDRSPAVLWSKLLAGSGTLLVAGATAWIAVVVLAWRA